MFQANQSAWVMEQFVKAGTVWPSGHPLVRHAPALFDELVEETDNTRKPTVRKVAAK